MSFLHFPSLSNSSIKSFSLYLSLLRLIFLSIPVQSSSNTSNNKNGKNEMTKGPVIFVDKFEGIELVLVDVVFLKGCEVLSVAVDVGDVGESDYGVVFILEFVLKGEVSVGFGYDDDFAFVCVLSVGLITYRKLLDVFTCRDNEIQPFINRKISQISILNKPDNFRAIFMSLRSPQIMNLTIFRQKISNQQSILNIVISNKRARIRNNNIASIIAISMRIYLTILWRGYCSSILDYLWSDFELFYFIFEIQRDEDYYFLLFFFAQSSVINLAGEYSLEVGSKYFFVCLNSSDFFCFLHVPDEDKSAFVNYDEADVIFKNDIKDVIDFQFTIGAVNYILFGSIFGMDMQLSSLISHCDHPIRIQVTYNGRVIQVGTEGYDG